VITAALGPHRAHNLIVLKKMSIEDRAEEIEALDRERTNKPHAAAQMFAPGDDGYKKPR
jgi:hypothetical protein